MPNCAANQRTCPNPAVITNPVPLCRSHSIEVALAVVPQVLGTALANHEPHSAAGTRRREPMHTVNLRRGERAALDQMVANGKPITRRNVAAAIRNAGGSCSNRRALELCRFLNDQA